MECFGEGTSTNDTYEYRIMLNRFAQYVPQCRYTNPSFWDSREWRNLYKQVYCEDRGNAYTLVRMFDTLDGAINYLQVQLWPPNGQKGVKIWPK
jgi:hypothetical protein